jgi:aspartyl/glutamyl-tRNA(Asn/Gln) amidotransferase C subunit
MIDDKTMKNLQDLSRLKLEPEESLSLAVQLEDILRYFERLAAYDTADTDMMPAVTPGDLRRDESTPSFSRGVLESVSVEFQDGHFIVPRILGDDHG